MNERIEQILRRLTDYPWWEIVIELAVLWVIVYAVYRFVRGTRAAGALKGLLFLLIGGTVLVRLIAQGELFSRLAVLWDAFLGFAALVLVVTFQPELRRALIHLGEAPLFRSNRTDVGPVIDALCRASVFLSKSKFGAIIAIERNVGFREVIETGKPLNADVSAHLLNTIFWPNSPLHDMGVVVRGNKIVAAGVQFPLAHPSEVPQERMGTRHRAAVGLARITDAIVIVVSEETGRISLAEGRELLVGLSPTRLREELTERFTEGAPIESTASEGAPVPTPEPAEPATQSKPKGAKVGKTAATGKATPQAKSEKVDAQ